VVEAGVRNIAAARRSTGAGLPEAVHREAVRMAAPVA
jgi:hypothetical protein